MLSDLEIALVGIYFFSALGLGVFGLHRLWLVTRFRRAMRAESRRVPPPEPEEFPRVLVQLPLYNERYVAARVIQAAAAMDYPADRFRIQVLDDSTDETRDAVDQTVAQARKIGPEIVVVRRDDRSGFKAGALAHGLKDSDEELVAIFDADFIPPADWLRRVVGEFRDAKVGLVQTPWSFLNADTSPLTRAQADFLQGHFAVEHRSRAGSGHFFNFNGTAGIWRRKAIDDAGGWSADTLTEDLDLSYRAQMKGWRFVYRSDIAAPSELPADWGAYKKQQRRWTKGGAQVALKILPKLLFGRGVKQGARLEGLAHLSCNIGYVLLLIFAILTLPILVLRSRYQLPELAWADGAALAFGTFSVGVFYYISQRLEGKGRLLSAARAPVLMAFGIALALNNARAFLEGLLGFKSPFERTAKYGAAATSGNTRKRKLAYASKADWQTVFEIGLALYFFAALVYGLPLAPWQSWPFLILFAWGFALGASLSLGQLLGGLPLMAASEGSTQAASAPADASAACGNS